SPAGGLARASLAIIRVGPMPSGLGRLVVLTGCVGWCCDLVTARMFPRTRRPKVTPPRTTKPTAGDVLTRKRGTTRSPLRGFGPPDQPITTRTVIGVPASVEDGIEQVARYVGENDQREGKFEFYRDGVLVRISLSDKATRRSWTDDDGDSLKAFEKPVRGTF